MTIPRKPYLIRAMHEWICDSDLTPHLVVDATADNVSVPQDHVDDGKIILNVSHSATRGLALGNSLIAFETRFGGRAIQIEVPCAAVLGIYARETGEGMIFTGEDAPDDPDGGVNPDAPGPRPRPALKVVK